MKQLLLICAAVALVGCGENRAISEWKEGQKARAKAAAEANATVTPKPEPPKATPKKLITDPIVEKAIRKELKKPTGELTQADLEKVTELELDDKQLTSVKGLEKLTQLESLHLPHNKLTNVTGLENLTQLKTLWLFENKLTKAQIDELQKALPNCKIYSNPTK